MNSGGVSLASLLQDMTPVAIVRNPAITGLALDSRAVVPGALFLALPGTRVDGRNYIAGALARGAAAVAFESGDGFDCADLEAITIPVNGLRQQVGNIAARFYRHPSHQCDVIGVTGTNGKTTTTQLLAQALDRPDARCGVIGTLGAGFPGALDPTAHTTPDAVELQGRLAQLLSQGARTVCMEVSSHALDQGRAQGVDFKLALFTNLTRDHLDYHGDMTRYGAAKARLFDSPGLQVAVINVDDAFGRALAEALSPRLRVLRYGLESGDVSATAVRAHADGLEIEARTPAGSATLRCGLIGRFNAANLLGVLAVLLARGTPLEQAVAVLAQVRPVPGRMERLGGGGKPLVVVDYAHTPDALEQALLAVRAHVRGRVLCVFGCGGDRDRGKRPEMGRIAGHLADLVIVTDDNPRHEDPDQIVREIVAGMRVAPTVVRDRSKAIHFAIKEAGPGDAVLIAGKGHEDYQQIGERRLPFSDRAVAAAALGLAA